MHAVCAFAKVFTIQLCDVWQKGPQFATGDGIDLARQGADLIRFSSRATVFSRLCASSDVRYTHD